MPSLFPELFNFSFIAPFVLRIALGAPLIKHGFAKLTTGGFGKITVKEKIPKRILGGIIFLSGVFLVVGLFTQAAAMTVSLIIIVSSIIMRGQHPRPWTERLIKLAIAVSLILTGPGLFAFDFPL
jgi:uncharacterized membrane protein YphA (DoxX/SURF4 family)